MDARLRVAFVLPSLSFGGAERVMLTLLEHVNRKRFAPVLAVGEASGQYAGAVPADVPVAELGGARVRHAVPGLVRWVRRQRPDVVFSTLGYLNVLIMLGRGLMPASTVFIGRETNIPSHNLPRSPWPRLLPFLYRRMYPRFDAVVCQSHDMRRDMVDNFRLPEGRAHVIHNPVDTERIMQRAQEGGDPGLSAGRVHLVAAGKLMHQKGFDLLLAALAASGREDMHLTILGDGPERDALTARARELGVDGRTTFAGFVDNPYPYMHVADAFVLSSRFEGFPNVVLEAMACGTPVLAFACPGGLREIITPGVNGWLVPPQDVGEMARALADHGRAPLDADTVRASVEDRYGVGHIAGLYEDLFLRAAGRLHGSGAERTR